MSPVGLSYPNRVHEPTHCDRLSVRARMFGIEAASADHCRVLELGCAGGANLVAMAADLSGSEFVGVDTMRPDIDAARRLAEEAAVPNVRFEARDVLELELGPTTDYGAFDFIIAHGLFSWVGPDVRTKVLELFGSGLAPNGVAYLSYNTLPGWYSRAKARDFMRYHTSQIADAKKRIEQGLAALKWLSESVDGSATYGIEARAELDYLRNTAEGYIFHEHFVEHGGDASYFHDVVRQASAFGLSFLAESEATTIHRDSLAPSARVILAKIDDPIRAEQYIDFLVDRRFRATLFCREDCAKKGGPEATIAASFLSATCSIDSEAVAMDLSDRALTVTSPQGTEARIGQPVLKLALGLLVRRAPEAFEFKALVDAIVARLPASAHASSLAEGANTLSPQLAGAMLHLSSLGFVKVRGFAPAVTAHPTALPVSRSLARVEVRGGTVATNVWHEPVPLGTLECALVPLLDGTHDVGSLAALTSAPERDVAVSLARLGRAGILVG